MEYINEDQVELTATGEIGKVVMVDLIYKQAEVEFPDKSSSVYFFTNLRKVVAN